MAVRPSILNRANAQEMEKWVEATYLKMSPQERVSQIMIMAINPGEGVFFLRSSRGNGTLTFTKPSGL